MKTIPIAYLCAALPHTNWAFRSNAGANYWQIQARCSTYQPHTHTHAREKCKLVYKKIVKLCNFFLSMCVIFFCGKMCKLEKKLFFFLRSARVIFFAVNRVNYKKIEKLKEMQLLQYMSNMYSCRFRMAPHSDLNDGTPSQDTKHIVLCVATN